MNFFKFKKYKFIASYEIKTSTKIDYLLKEYENLFINYKIEKNNYSEKDKEKIFKGIQEVSQYIINGIFYQLLESYNSKSSLEKKVETLLKIAENQYDGKTSFKEYLEEELIILAETVIFESIGMIESKKHFEKTTEKSNIIYFMKQELFYKFLEFLDERVNTFNQMKIDLNNEYYEDEDLLEKEQLIEVLMKDSLLDKAISNDLKEKIKYALLNNDITKETKPYIEFLVSFKEKTYDTNNN